VLPRRARLGMGGTSQCANRIEVKVEPLELI
jgi:hypothetical protein